MAKERNEILHFQFTTCWALDWISLLFSERRFAFRCSIGLLRNSASFALVSFGFIAFCTSHSLWTSNREALKCSDAKQPGAGPVDLLMTGDNVLGPLAARFSISTGHFTSID